MNAPAPQPHKSVACAPRKSGLTRLQLALMGKGPTARIRAAARGDQR